MDRWGPTDATRHLAGMRRYARALTQDAVAADDLVQQALLSAYESSGTFRPGSSLRAWLFAILHNEFVSGQRRMRSEQRALTAFAERALPADAHPDQAVLLRETATRFAALPETQRAVLHLIAVEGMSYQQAAATLALPIGTVMSRLSRARAALREAAEPCAAGRPLRIVGGQDAS